MHAFKGRRTDLAAAVSAKTTDNSIGPFHFSVDGFSILSAVCFHYMLFSLTVYWLRSLGPKSRRPNVQVSLVRNLLCILHSAPVGLDLQYFDPPRSLVPTSESLGVPG